MTSDGVLLHSDVSTLHRYPLRSLLRQDMGKILTPKARKHAEN